MLAAARMSLVHQNFPPLGNPIRSGDDIAVSQLLNHGANLSRREDGGNDPIFLAIQVCSADYVRLLLEHRADPRSREAVRSADSCERGRRSVRRRTALEAAASFPRIRRVILDAIADR